MDAELRRALEAGLTRRGAGATVAGSRTVGGGSIHRAEWVELSGGGALFVKSNREEAAGAMFEAEALGLAALAATQVLRVPGDPWTGQAGETAFLVMEAIDEGPRGPGFWESFGRGLAELHHAGRGERFGFSADNFIGSTPQPNPWTDDGAAFVREHRLGFQLSLARSRGHADPRLDRLGERLLARLDEWLDLPDEPPCLIHGDLWSGNFLVDDRGRPVLVDPAAHYGHREADLAMSRLFGGFAPAFYDAYEEAWPLPPGAEERQAIHQLYHLLNHLNLFGGGYRDGCLRLLGDLVG